MNVHLQNALRLLKQAVLPDRTIGAIVDQALQGSTKSSKPVFKAMGQDVFEVFQNPIKAMREVVAAFKR